MSEATVAKPVLLRTLAGSWDRAIKIMMGATALYYVWASTVGVVSLQYYRGIAVVYSLVVPLLLYKGWQRARADRPTLIDLLLAAGATASVVYWMVEHEAMAYRAGDYTSLDVAMGAIATVIAIEAARRVLGWDMALCAIVPIIYALFGNYLPFIIGHRGYSMRRIIEYVYLTSDGIFGIMAEVLAEYIIPFVAFGAFLERAGVAQFFVDISLAGLGRIAGGPAQASVVSSLLMGTISGSPIAETVTKGSITIPLMKRAGFPGHIAGAVEAAASTGAAIMPPVMGAGAFVMSEMTGIPYVEIIKVAAIPGLLYFLSVGVMIYFESKKLGLKGLPPKSCRAAWDVWRRGWYLFLPIAVLIAVMISGYSPQIAALYGIIVDDRRQLDSAKRRAWGRIKSGRRWWTPAKTASLSPRSPVASACSSACCRSPASSSAFPTCSSNSPAKVFSSPLLSSPAQLLCWVCRCRSRQLIWSSRWSRCRRC